MKGCVVEKSMVLYASRMTDSRTSKKYILLGIFFLLSLSIHEFTHVFEKDDAHHQEVIGFECDVCEYNETDFADNSNSLIKKIFDENLFLKKLRLFSKSFNLYLQRAPPQKN